MAEPAKNSSTTFLSGAMFRFGSFNPHTGKQDAKDSSLKSELFPKDIPYDELMQLCLKLNKRMQVMEAKGQELVKRGRSLSNDRRHLLDLFSEIVGKSTMLEDDEIIDIESLRENWAKAETEKIQSLQTHINTSSSNPNYNINKTSSSEQLSDQSSLPSINDASGSTSAVDIQVVY